VAPATRCIPDRKAETQRRTSCPRRRKSAPPPSMPISYTRPRFGCRQPVSTVARPSQAHSGVPAPAAGQANPDKRDLFQPVNRVSSGTAFDDATLRHRRKSMTKPPPLNKARDPERRLQAAAAVYVQADATSPCLRSMTFRGCCRLKPALQSRPERRLQAAAPPP